MFQAMLSEDPEKPFGWLVGWLVGMFVLAQSVLGVD